MKIILTLVLTSLSCIALPIGINSIEIPSGQVQYQDDFSDINSGWLRSRDAHGNNLDYVHEGYLIHVNQNNTLLWSGPGLDFTDVQIEVDVMKIGGTENDDFGVICRAKDQNQPC